MCAVKKGNMEMVELLLSMGANVALQNNLGITAAMLAAEHEDPYTAAAMVQLIASARRSKRELEKKNATTKKRRRQIMYQE